MRTSVLFFDPSFFVAACMAVSALGCGSSGAQGSGTQPGPDAAPGDDGAADGRDDSADGAMDGPADAPVDAAPDSEPADAETDGPEVDAPDDSSTFDAQDAQLQCQAACGTAEQCDDLHVGLDDDCDGEVDEGCPCDAGSAHACFLGDPGYEGQPGCYDGTQRCVQGSWGPCVGGVHATDSCYVPPSQCHAIDAYPLSIVALSSGLGGFGADALPGSEAWEVSCPSTVGRCPAPSAGAFKPLQSGEYTVIYTKQVAGDPTPQSCTFPLVVGAPGLRFELVWEHSASDSGVDLDLHVHQPGNTQPWGTSPSVPQDCAWGNCTAADFTQGGVDTPDWFSSVAPPDPVDWSLNPDPEENTCYGAPRGYGQEWQAYGKGCHNPRLELDTMTCDDAVGDPLDPQFCMGESTAIDYPPVGEWFRVAVHYFSNHGLGYDVHPHVAIYCDGALAADLGPYGYYAPEAPITFAPEQGASLTGGNAFWLAADVAYKDIGCGRRRCVVRPLYADGAAKTPLVVTDAEAVSAFGPPYPPGL